MCNKKLIILHVTDKSYPPLPDDGGAPVSLRALEKIQKTSNDFVEILTSAAKESKIAYAITGEDWNSQFVRILKKYRFDIVHFHAHAQLFQASASQLGVPSICHVHGDHHGQTSAVHNRIYVSKAHAIRHWATAYVHNGVDLNSLPFVSTPKEYFTFLGKVRRSKKGADTAVAVAKKMQRPLKVIGGRKFSIPETWLPISRYVHALGVLGGGRKLKALSQAKALLFPIRWEEPFGLVLIEAMACGVPVIAFNRGAVPEIVKDGVTGFIVEDFDQMCQAVEKIDEIERAACRQHVADHFSIERTAQGVEEYYRRAIAGEIW